jgi:hypothetical protein
MFAFALHYKILVITTPPHYDNDCGASTKAVYQLFTKHLRDSGVAGEAVKRKLKKDISFALRRGTIAQVTTLLPALDRRATSDEPAQRVRSSRWRSSPLSIHTIGRWV